MIACSESGAEDKVYTHEAEVFARKIKAGEGCDEQVAARNLNVMEAIARETKSQGDQVARHPRLLNRGEPIGRRRYDPDRETHPETSTSGSPHTNQGKTSQHCESKTPQAETWGAEKERNVFQSNAFRRVKAVTTGGTENGPKKEERHDRDDSAYDQAQEGTRAES